MTAALEIVLAATVGWVGISLWLVSRERLTRRAVKVSIAVLTLLAIGTAVLVPVSLAIDRWEWRELAVVAGGFAVAALAQVGALGLAGGLRRARSIEELEARVLGEIDAVLAAGLHDRAHALEQTLERERAETVHLLGERERAMREERRRALEEELRTAAESLVASVGESQQRLEQRMAAWSVDLERAQQQLKSRLEELVREQAEALRSHEHRLSDHAAELGALEEHQAASIGRMRADIEQAIEEALAGARNEIEVHAADRRRTLHEVSERLRSRERGIREQIEREEAELKAQFTTSSQEIERRFLEQLTRGLDRSVMRLSEDAERQFDRQLREARERTADRLSRELELSLEHFVKAAEAEVVNRITEAAQVSASRFQRQIDDLVRAAEAQAGVSSERISALAERLGAVDSNARRDT